MMIELSEHQGDRIEGKQAEAHGLASNAGWSRSRRQLAPSISIAPSAADKPQGSKACSSSLPPSIYRDAGHRLTAVLTFDKSRLLRSWGVEVSHPGRGHVAAIGEEGRRLRERGGPMIVVGSGSSPPFEMTAERSSIRSCWDALRSAAQSCGLHLEKLSHPIEGALPLPIRVGRDSTTLDSPIENRSRTTISHRTNLPVRRSSAPMPDCEYNPG